MSNSTRAVCGTNSVSRSDKMLARDTGILSGTTAFGKTVVAIRLIAERKVNTLVLVDKVSFAFPMERQIVRISDRKRDS